MVVNGVANKVRLGTQLKFTDNVSLMSLHRFSGDIKPGGDLLIGVAKGDKGKDLAFAVGKGTVPNQIDVNPV